MRTWTIGEASANVSSVFDEALNNGPQRIERRDGEPVVVVADLILNSPIEPDDLPERRPARVVIRDFL